MISKLETFGKKFRTELQGYKTMCFLFLTKYCDFELFPLVHKMSGSVFVTVYVCASDSV